MGGNLAAGKGVQRYPLPIAEWARVQWASEEARALWEPRIAAIVHAWEAAERASVGRFRRACLQSVAPEAMPALAARAAERALVTLPLERQAAAASYQAANAGPPTGGKPWQYRVALVTRDAALDWQAAWAESDDEKLGELLGFPSCCRDFFRRVWAEGGWRDTTWPMSATGGPKAITVAGQVECNILLRWIGVRWIPHLPCAFDCGLTAVLGAEFRALMPDREARWMDELLDSPTEWSALHGIAEIRTPLFTISASTDATAEKLIVRRKGRGYPEAGARGLRFPYHREPERIKGGPVHFPSKKHDTAYRGPHGESDPVTEGLVDSSEWTDNGFSSREAMEAAHMMLLHKLLAIDCGTVVDLGCGNGLLLSRVAANRRVGVESDPQRAESARQRLDRVIVGDCTDPALIAHVMAEERPDVLIAQRDRNPPESLPAGVRVLSYSYEAMEAAWR